MKETHKNISYISDSNSYCYRKTAKHKEKNLETNFFPRNPNFRSNACRKVTIRSKKFQSPRKDQSEDFYCTESPVRSRFNITKSTCECKNLKCLFPEAESRETVTLTQLSVYSNNTLQKARELLNYEPRSTFLQKIKTEISKTALPSEPFDEPKLKYSNIRQAYENYLGEENKDVDVKQTHECQVSGGNEITEKTVVASPKLSKISEESVSALPELKEKRNCDMNLCSAQTPELGKKTEEVVPTLSEMKETELFVTNLESAKTSERCEMMKKLVCPSPRSKDKETPVTDTDSPKIPDQSVPTSPEIPPLPIGSKVKEANTHRSTQDKDRRRKGKGSEGKKETVTKTKKRPDKKKATKKTENSPGRKNSPVSKEEKKSIKEDYKKCGCPCKQINREGYASSMSGRTVTSEAAPSETCVTGCCPKCCRCNCPSEGKKKPTRYELPSKEKKMPRKSESPKGNQTPLTVKSLTTKKNKGYCSYQPLQTFVMNSDLADLQSFRKQFFFQTHCIPKMEAHKKHKCVHQLVVDENMQVSPLNPDPYGYSRCVHCNRAMNCVINLTEKVSKEGSSSEKGSGKKPTHLSRYTGAKVNLVPRKIHTGKKDEKYGKGETVMVKMPPRVKGYEDFDIRKYKIPVPANTYALRHQKRAL